MNENSALVAMPLVETYTDGGCEPNPGRGGYGVVWLHPKKRAEASGGFRLRQLQLRFRPRGFVVRAEDELNVGMHGGVADFADELARGE